MKLGGLVSMLALATSALIAHPALPASQKPDMDPRDLRNCRLTAVHPADNDIHRSDDRGFNSVSATLPPLVARNILDHVSELAKKNFTVEDWREGGQGCADIFSPVFALNGPAGLRLYVVPRYFPLGNSVDYFVMYDPRTGAFTRLPPLIYTKWWEGFDASDPLVKRPVVRMEPSARGRPPLLIVQERVHNGNVYDAAVYRYFENGKDMALTQVLAVEARAILLSNRDEYNERRVKFLTPDRVRIDVSSRSPRKLAANGSVLLERATSGRPFHVVQRMPVRGSRREGLVTYCDSSKSDDDFLRVGCDLYY